MIPTFIVFQTQQSQFVTWQFETEYRGSDFTAAVTVANPDVLRESGETRYLFTCTMYMIQ